MNNEQSPKVIGSATKMSKTFHDLSEVIKDPKFQECMNIAVLGIIQRSKVLPPPKMKFRRTPIDSLIDMGYIHETGTRELTDEFMLISVKASSLSGILRNAIIEICNGAIKDMVASYSTTIFNGMTFMVHRTNQRIYVRSVDRENNLLYINKTYKTKGTEGGTGFNQKEEEWKLSETFEGFESGKYEIKPKAFMDYPPVTIIN